MVEQTLAASRATPAWLSIIACAALGLGILVVAGHVQASALHDAAHDVRHATGFPCH